MNIIGARASLFNSTAPKGFVRSTLVGFTTGAIALATGARQRRAQCKAPKGGDGGFIENLAARVRIADRPGVTATAASGGCGAWLFNQQDYTIAATGGDFQ